MKRQLLLLSILFCFYNISSLTAKESKIVGLMAFRNEENFLAQHLKALSLYTDAIVVLDDASTDNSLHIAHKLADECNIERIIAKEIWYRDEPGDRNKLLQAGREIDGTHFICIDADEMFTSNLLEHDRLRKTILSLQPRETLEVLWIQLWRSIDFYRFDNSVWTWNYKRIIFCDDKTSHYSSEFIHTGPVPFRPKKIYKLSNAYDVGLLHFQFVNWNNLLLKQAWYRCLERIRLPHKAIHEINDRYAPSKQEQGLHRQPSKPEWFNYSFFDASVYEKPDNWRKEQVNEWFEEYGKKYFEKLDIWDVNWNI